MSAENSPDPADHARRIESIVRFGTIAAVDPAAARVRVKTGGLTTEWLPWLERRAGTTRDWDPPTVGEQCIVLAPSGEPAAGVVLCGIFSTAHPAPSQSADECARVFPDGTKVTYHHAQKQLTIDAVGDVTVNAAGDAQINAGGNAQVRAGGFLQVIAQGRLLVKSLTQLILAGPSRKIVL